MLAQEFCSLRRWMAARWRCSWVWESHKCCFLSRMCGSYSWLVYFCLFHMLLLKLPPHKVATRLPAWINVHASIQLPLINYNRGGSHYGSIMLEKLKHWPKLVGRIGGFEEVLSECFCFTRDVSVIGATIETKRVCDWRKINTNVTTQMPRYLCWYTGNRKTKKIILVL